MGRPFSKRVRNLNHMAVKCKREKKNFHRNGRGAKRQTQEGLSVGRDEQ